MRTEEAFHIYIEKLVKSMPLWIKKLFDAEQICFVMDDEGQVIFGISKELDKNLAERATKRIAKYLGKGTRMNWNLVH
jgi:hypothetical protein